MIPLDRIPPSPARRAVALLLAIASCALLLDAGWIHAKAMLAQHLLLQSWQAQHQDGKPHPPWPWADTHPVARLRVPRLGVDQIVLAGDSGRILAFGPGWAEASAAPGRPGTTAISGHRDTHFEWLRELQTGDLLELEGPSGSRKFRISQRQIVDAREQRIALNGDSDRLLLVTCWPFDGLDSGGPERLLVSAEACDQCRPPAASATLAAR